MRGSSGATFEQPTGGSVRKTGNGDCRVLKQGLWLEDHPSPIFPMIYTTGMGSGGEDDYAMERLDPLPVELLDTRATIAEVVAMLDSHLWCKPAEVENFDWQAHADRMEPLQDFLTGEQSDTMSRLLDSIKWSRVRMGLTHGDPILDNLMLRDGKLVLIDPIPATPAIPDMISVDLGRLLQSAVGYERVRYGLEGPMDMSTADFDMYANDWNEWRATVYWAAVHLLRSMAYVDSHVVKNLQDVCLSKVMEAASWTL